MQSGPAPSNGASQRHFNGFRVEDVWNGGNALDPVPQEYSLFHDGAPPSVPNSNQQVDSISSMSIYQEEGWRTQHYPGSLIIDDPKGVYHR